jgi:hypothetical protein
MPSGFCHFDHMKRALAGKRFSISADFHDGILAFLDEIETYDG